MTDPIPELPDDTPIESVQFRERIRKALSAVGLKTIGEVREMSDRELLKVPGLGSGSLIYLRKSLGLASSQGVNNAASLLPVSEILTPDRDPG